MNDQFNSLQEVIDRYAMRHYRVPTRIKVTTDFADRLTAQCQYEVMLTKDDSPRGYVRSIFNIPLEIDDTMNDDYKIIYEEEN